MRNAAAVLLVLLPAGAALAQQAPTPIPQTVVAPSLPDEKNKEGTVRPGATQQSDAGGWVQTNTSPIDPNAPKTSAPAAGAAAPSGAAPGPGIVAPAMPSPPAEGPRGPAVVNAADITLRGVVKAFEKGVSITITEANGKDRTVPLADKAVVYDGIAVGDKVVLRVPLRKPADGKHTDRVEKQKPPKAAPASKFSQAQTPKS